MKSLSATLLAAALAMSAGAADARSVGQRLALVNGIPPSTVIDFRAGTYAPLTEARTGTVWEYNSTGAIGSFATLTPRQGSWSQRTPTQPRGLGQFLGKTNIWLNNTQTQTRAVSNGTSYTFWCDSANGTDTVVFTSGLLGTATCNGWPGALTATAVGVSAIGTVVGTVTHGQLTTTANGPVSPPIVTVGAAVTANSDLSSFLTSFLANWTAYRGTVVVTFIPTTTQQAASFLSFSDGTTANRITLQSAIGGAVSGINTVGSSPGAFTSPGSIVLNAVNKLVYTWDGVVAGSSLNGGPFSAASTTAPFPEVLTRAGIGNNHAGGVQCNCYPISVRHFPNALPSQINKLSQQ